MELGTGEAVISLLQHDGTPAVCERASVLPPQSLIGGIDDGERDRCVKGSMLYTAYYEPEDPAEWREECFKRYNERVEHLKTISGDFETLKR